MEKLKLLNLRNAGAMLGISGRSVRRLIDRKLLSCYKIGGLIKVSEGDIFDYLTRSKMPAVDITNGVS